MSEREAGRALAQQVKGHVSALIDRRLAEMEPPEVRLTSYATVDTTAIGDALRGLAPIIEQSISAGHDIRAAIAEAVMGWQREDAAIARAIEAQQIDFTGLIEAITGRVEADYSGHLVQLSRDIGGLVLALDKQAAAIRDQTERMEAAALATRSVSYDSSGRVTQIRVGK